MVTAAELLDAVVKAPTLDGRVAAIRTIPEHVGTAAQPSLYADIARQLYVDTLGACLFSDD